MSYKLRPDAVAGFSLMKFMGVFLISLIAFSVLFTVRNLTVVEARNLYSKLQKAIVEGNDVGDDGELLPRGLFDEKSCLSRYQSLLYRRGLPRTPSPHLLSKLRSYEARHKKCAPYTHSYNATLKALNLGVDSTTLECKYIVWIPMNGLGNQMLSLASAFLYALLTDRALLLHRGVDIPDLFCEPFPEASWLIPSDFPFTFDSFKFSSSRSHQSYGNVLRRLNSTASSPPRPYIYVHLAHDYDHGDKRFFCDEDHTYLHQIPWLILRSDLYFVPPLFLMSLFQQELHKLFPEKDAVFHLLARYLFHPTNSVWGLVTRYYQAYLSNAHVIAGIQIRVFHIKPLLTQILSCTMRENILPQIMTNNNQSTNDSNINTTTVAVLTTSLSSGYYDQLREMYLENPTAAGEVVGVFQPSHEEFQQTEKHSHNRKALAEMYMLSFADKLVTSGWSTFGYVAQGLGGLKPWILYKPESGTVAPEPPCRRAISMEPCFHRPHSYYCESRRGGVAPVAHVGNCEVTRGLKLLQFDQ